jgi:hypothetical protein
VEAASREGSAAAFREGAMICTTMPHDALADARRKLYALPLDQFTPARDALARELRAQGQRDAADAVKALRKPSGAAWAVNQLAHRRAEDVRELLDAGRRLRDAQEQLLRGGGRGALDEARDHERALVGRLAQDAAVLAAEAGMSPTPALVERLRSTLHAVAVDEEAAAEVAEGRVVREREAVGFPAFAGTASPPAPRAARADRDRAVREQLREAERALREASRRAATAQRALDRARERADAALADLRRAEAQERGARDAQRAAQTQVSDLEARLRRAR